MDTTRSDYVKHCVIGVLIYLLLNLILAGMLAYLINKEVIQISSLIYAVPVVQFLSSIISAAYLCKKEKNRRIIKCLIEAALVLVTIILFTVVFFSAELRVMMTGVLTIIMGYLSTAIVQNKKKSKANIPRYK